MRANLDQERELYRRNEDEEQQQPSHSSIIEWALRTSLAPTLAAAALAGAACASSVDPTVIAGEARVTDVSVVILESFPVQAEAVVSGELPDGCTSIDEVTTSREGRELRIRLTTVRPADAFCTQAVVPFEERVRLDVLGLEAGEYRVVANGVATTFRLDVDNR